MSSSVMYERLNELATAQLVAKNPEGRYTLTASGETLGGAIASLDRWANDWAAAQ